jgi:hypothetical protein
MSHPAYPSRSAEGSHLRVWLDKCHEITHADTLKASPPPDWTADDESAHARAWRRKHVSNPSTADRIEAQKARAARQASEMPSAEYWREVFGC